MQNFTYNHLKYKLQDKNKYFSTKLKNYTIYRKCLWIIKAFSEEKARD